MIRCERPLEYWAAGAAGANPLSALRAITMTRYLLDAWEEFHVRALRRDGATWDAIACALSITRQAAWSRWASALEGPTRRTPRGAHCRYRGCGRHDEQWRAFDAAVTVKRRWKL